LLEQINDKIERDFGAEEFGLAGDPVTAAFRHHFRSKGKQTRAGLSIRTSQALGHDAQALLAFAACVETLHNASLIQDDFQDRALERRGHPTVHAVFGRDVALGLTTRLVSSAFVSLQSFDANASAGELVRHVHRALSLTIFGQTRDLQTEGERSVDELLAIAKHKSGPLFALALELPLLAANQHQALPQAHESACLFGLGYQILDDIKDQRMDRLQPHDANIVNALAKDRRIADPVAFARDLAKNHLEQAQELASGLPMGSGSCLQEMAGGLLKTLTAPFLSFSLSFSSSSARSPATTSNSGNSVPATASISMMAAIPPKL
jgi:geranylgeranyl pyrophosphate synthase